MASSKPIVRQVNWFSLIPQFIVVAVFIYGYYLMGISDPYTFGLLSFFVLLIMLRYLVPRNHRKGIVNYKRGNYQVAVEEFRKSYEFFERHPWIDKYRVIILLSSSRMPYQEMALVNRAFCYSLLGDGLKAKELYEEALIKFPDSQMAMSGLKILEAGKDLV